MDITCKNCIYAVPNRYSVQGIRCDSGDSDCMAELEIEGIQCAKTCSMFSSTVGDKYGYITNDKALKFILAGRCEFVAISGKTGVKIVYEMKRKQSNRGNGDEFIYYLKTKIDSQMVYAGVIFYDKTTELFKFVQGVKGKVSAFHVNIKSILYILNNFNKGRTTLNLRIYHVGKCGRCGRKLTDEQSILTGLGPTCARLSKTPKN